MHGRAGLQQRRHYRDRARAHPRSQVYDVLKPVVVEEHEGGEAYDREESRVVHD